jgi:hypothetical protein
MMKDVLTLIPQASAKASTMSHEDLFNHLRERPFRPFRLVLTEGTVYEVRHPELFMLGNRSVVIGLPRHPTETTYERTTMVDLFHIVRLEPLEAPTASGPSGNGA